MRIFLLFALCFASSCIGIDRARAAPSSSWKRAPKQQNDVIPLRMVDLEGNEYDDRQSFESGFGDDNEQLASEGKLGAQMQATRIAKLRFAGDEYENHEYFLLVKRKLQKLIANEQASNQTRLLSKPSEVKDKLFIDHSQSGCVNPVRDQGDNCNSCYAFATVAIFEYFYCRKHGKRVQFSEQYLIDCGRPYVGSELIDGCKQGSFYGTANFVQNFGLELRANYKYLGVEQKCPLNEVGSIQASGAVRIDSDAYFLVPIELWEEYLHYGPLLVLIFKEATNFNSYTGGLHQLEDCDRNSLSHMMVLLGHGVENGTEYWKMRNSYSEDWGEQGHYRVSKRSHPCFFVNAVVFASRDGRHHQLERLEKNAQYKAPVL